MTPWWFRIWKIIYNALSAKRIGEFEIVKNDTDISLIEHSDPPISWMANCGNEWRLYRNLYIKVHGKVLIAGLGLGFDLLNVASKKMVTEIVVVEKNQAIIDLVWPYIPYNKAILVHQNILRYLQTTRETFDTIYFDIFPGGSEFFPKEMIRLQNLAETKLRVNGQVIFFQETFVPIDNCQEDDRSFTNNLIE